MAWMDVRVTESFYTDLLVGSVIVVMFFSFISALNLFYLFAYSSKYMNDYALSDAYLSILFLLAIIVYAGAWIQIKKKKSARKKEARG